MIFQNIEIHGCSELELLQNGAYATLRVPKAVEEHLSPMGQSQNKNCTGIEFRFVLKGEEATLHFGFEDDESGEITVFYGDFVADWPETTKRVKGECEVKIVRNQNLERLRAIAKEYGHRFSPDVVRLVFCGVRPKLIEVKGEIELPAEEICPKCKYLAYGSSITHGSNALHPYYDYAERVAADLGADLTNFGFAGSALLQREMADFFAEKCEFDFATLEMGINILKIEPQDYEGRVRYFVDRVARAHPKAKIFAIDVYYCESDLVGDGKAECFRGILKRVVEELDLPNVVYVNGKAVLSSPAKLSAGLVHPNPDGMLEMAEKLSKIMRKHL